MITSPSSGIEYTNINLDEYDYPLPSEKIAQYPLKERDGSRLLLYKDRVISEDLFRNIDKLIPSGSLLVFNNTKVIRARLIFPKESGARIEVFCLEPLDPSDYSISFGSRKSVEWKCLVGNIKRWKEGTIVSTFVRADRLCKLFAEKLNREGDAWRIRFRWIDSELTFGEVIEAAGHIPLPPYLNRPDEDQDSERYQTIYSEVRGSVAAPTAGLHFTEAILKKLHTRDIHLANLTLHVGAGTFQPVKSDNISEHLMHSEHFFITRETIEQVYKNTGSVIAVGTTSVRTLESLYWLGIKLMQDQSITPENLYLSQWEAYNMKNLIPAIESLEILLQWMQENKLSCLHAPTRIIIIPGYDFRITSGMITNFHQPGSTLLLLVSAWAGKDWRRIYDYALDNNFRFLSYGDSSLLLR
jgi:S-adenosylmethionine:tRNA ribosyltransferase-isomerase